MICPQCHTENRDGAKFCDECGFRLPKEAAGATESNASASIDTAVVVAEADDEMSAQLDACVDKSCDDGVSLDESFLDEGTSQESSPDEKATDETSGSDGEPAEASAEEQATGEDPADEKASDDECVSSHDGVSEDAPAQEESDSAGGADRDGFAADVYQIDFGSLSLAEARAQSALSSWDELEAAEGIDLHSQKTGEIAPVRPDSSAPGDDPSVSEATAATAPSDSREEEPACVSGARASLTGGDEAGTASSAGRNAAAGAADLSGFDEYLVDSSYVAPQSAYRRGDTMKLPPITAEIPRQTSFVAPDPAEKSRRRKGASSQPTGQTPAVSKSDSAKISPAGSSEGGKAPSSKAHGKRIVLIVSLVVVIVAGICAGVTYHMELWGGKIVPDVTTMTQTDASYVLNNKGFKVRTTSVPSDDTEGIVLLMDPGAGSRQDEGSEVVIHISTARVIPDVVGKSADEAKKLFEDAGFTNVTFATERSDEAEGSVLSVDPGSGSKAKASSPITVTVAEPYTVPDVDGMSVEEAAGAIEDAGLVAYSVYVYNDSVAEGTMLGVEPAIGTKVESGSTVTISVSKSRGNELVSAARTYLSGGQLAASDGSTFSISSVDSCTYLGSDKVSFTATGRASTSVSVLGQTLSVSGDTKQVTGLVAFDSNNNVTSVSFQ